MTSVELTDEQLADLAAATVYVEAGRPIAGGRWHVLPDNTSVLYERTPGDFSPAVVTVDDLRNSDTWTEDGQH